METDAPLASDSAIQELPKAEPKKKIGSLRKVKKNVRRQVALEADKQVVASVEGKREVPEVGQNPSDSDGKEGAEKYLGKPHLGKRLHVEATKMSQSNTVMAQSSAVMVLNEEPLVIAPLPEGTKPLEMQPASCGNEISVDLGQIRKRRPAATEESDSKSSNHEDGSPKAKYEKLNVAIEDEPAFSNREGKFRGLQDISPKKAKKRKMKKKLNERHKNIDAGSKKRDRFADKRAKWLLEGLGGARGISKPELWISSYKIPKVKKGENAVGSMSPPSSPDGYKENAFPLERVSILQKSRNNNEEDASDKSGYQRPNADFLRQSVEPESHDDGLKSAKKRVRWRDPLVRVIRIGRVSRERKRPSMPVGRSSLHEHREIIQTLETSLTSLYRALRKGRSQVA